MMRAILYAMMLLLIPCFSGCAQTRLPRNPTPTVQPVKEVTRVEIQRVVIMDLSRLFQACLWIGLVGLSASIALMIFLPFLTKPASAGAAMFGSLFGLSFLSKLLLPFATWLAAFAGLLLIGNVVYLIYRLVQSEKVLQCIVPHVDADKLEGTAKRVIGAIQRKL